MGGELIVPAPSRSPKKTVENLNFFVLFRKVHNDCKGLVCHIGVVESFSREGTFLVSGRD